MKFLYSFLVLIFLGTSCASYSAQNPMNQAFPRVRGNALSGQSMVFPDDLENKPAIFVIGYKRKAQFDIDRWLLGLSTVDVKLPVYELPTVVGLLPSLFAEGIDNGMRSGIPKEDWSQVVTVYEDAEKVAKFTGNENGITGRVVLLDPKGKVQYFHDRGFSVGALKGLLLAIKSIDHGKTNSKS